MKKTLTVSLAALLLLLSACGGEGGAGPSASPQADVPATASPQAQVTAAPSTGGAAPAQATIEETVLVDQDGVKITATGLNYTSYSVELALTLENNTDQELSFLAGTTGCDCNTVNGYMCGGYLNTDIPAGKKANETISFSSSDLELFGITRIARLEVGFDIQDTGRDSYLRTGPIALETSLAEGYDPTADTYQDSVRGGYFNTSSAGSLDYFGDEVLYDQGGVRLLSQALLTNGDGEKALLVELENTTEAPLRVSFEGIAVNGLVIEDGTWTTDWLNGGARRVVVLYLANVLDGVYWDILGISQVGEVSFRLEVNDQADSTIAAPEAVTVTIPGASASFDGTGETLYEGNGVTILSKGLVPDSWDLSDDINVLLLLQNNGSVPVNVKVAYDSVSVNGYMTDTWSPSANLLPGETVVMELALRENSLAENSITAVEDITEVEVQFELRGENYKTIDAPVVTFAGTPAA